jgi:O-antigen/teichoic acid export membrane protein
MTKADAMHYLRNSSWMLAEQGIKLTSAIFVGIYIARYLGPEKFGILSYALATVSIFLSLSRLGMEAILVRELTSHHSEKALYIGTSFLLMFVGSTASLFTITGLTGLISIDDQTIVYTWVISIGIIFQPFLVFDYAFQSEAKAKLSSIGKSSILLIISIFRIFLVHFEADLIWFAISYAIEHMLVAIILLLVYTKDNYPNSIMSFSANLVKPLLARSWPMLMSGIAGMILLRVDQIMIRILLDEKHLGLYAAAAKIYQGWVSFPFILSLSLLPMLIKLKKASPSKYENSMTIFFSMVFWFCILVSIFVTIFKDTIIDLTFGPKFEASSNALVIMIWASAFSAIGFMSARYMIVEGMEKKIARRNWIAITINIPLNYILIPIFNIEGAAIASLASLIVVHYFIDIADDDLRQLLRIKNNSILFKFSR